MQREVARSRIYPWPTRVGRSIILIALVLRVVMEARTVAIGALIALAILVVADAIISTWLLSQRPVSVHAGKTMVVSPDRLTFTVEAEPGWCDLRIVLRRFAISDRDSEFVTLARTDTTQTVEMSDGLTHQSDHIRFLAETSFLGLVNARRWATQVTPILFRMSEPIAEDVAVASVDDRGRIRAYVPGDRMGSVSWGASARTGALHVRAPAQDLDEVTLVVDVGAQMAYEKGVNVADPIVARAFHIGRELLASGRTLRVVTNRVTPAIFEDERRAALRNPRNPRLKGLVFDDDGHHTFNGNPLTHVRSALAHSEAALIQELTALAVGPPIPAPRGPHIAVRRNETAVVRT